MLAVERKVQRLWEGFVLGFASFCWVFLKFQESDDSKCPGSENKHDHKVNLPPRSCLALVDVKPEEGQGPCPQAVDGRFAFHGRYCGRPAGIWQTLRVLLVRVWAAWTRVSGHSMRVRAALDMMLAGLDHLAIVQAGGWKSIDVLARYVENSAARTISERRWMHIRSTNTGPSYAAENR